MVGSGCPYILVDIITGLCHIPEHVQCLQSWRSRSTFGREWSLEFGQKRVLLFSPTCPNVSAGPTTGLASCYSNICGATHGDIVRFWIGWTAVIIGGLGMFYCLLRWRRNYVWGMREVISWVNLNGVSRPKRHWKVVVYQTWIICSIDRSGVHSFQYLGSSGRSSDLCEQTHIVRNWRCHCPFCHPLDCIWADSTWKRKGETYWWGRTSWTGRIRWRAYTKGGISWRNRHEDCECSLCAVDLGSTDVNTSTVLFLLQCLRLFLRLFKDNLLCPADICSNNWGGR